MASSPTNSGQPGQPAPPPAPIHTIGIPPPPDNNYRWRFGTTPIWVNPAFVDLFYDSVVQDMTGGPSFTSSANGQPSLPKQTLQQMLAQQAPVGKPKAATSDKADKADKADAAKTDASPSASSASTAESVSPAAAALTALIQS